MRIKAFIILVVLFLLPVCTFAQDPQSYSWSVTPPNVASVSWTNAQIGMFLDSVTDSILTHTISDFKFGDFDGDGQLELLAGVDFSGRGNFNTLEVVRRIQNTVAIQRIDVFALQTLSGISSDLNGDGKQELLLPQALTPYLGADVPQATWTAIYGWSNRLLVDMSAQFAAYYQSTLPSLKQILDGLNTTAPGSIQTAIAEMQYDKVRRISGQDPNAGYAQALVWASNSDPTFRIFAAVVFADIGTSDALSALNNLVGDSNADVAIYAGGAQQKASNARFTTVQIAIKPGSTLAPINLKSNGTIPVAILSSSTFNAPSSVNTASLTFGATGAEPSLSLCDPGGQDVNGDGLPDLVCHFDLQLSSFQPGDGSGTLRGKLKTGAAIQGSDSILVVNY